VTNYVTPKGLKQLKKEREELEKERGQLSGKDDGESRRELQIVNGKLEQLSARISSARVIHPEDQTKDEVRFGATVKLSNTETGEDRTFRIVGVDEANVKEGKIAFVKRKMYHPTNRIVYHLAKKRRRRSYLLC